MRELIFPVAKNAIFVASGKNKENTYKEVMCRVLRKSQKQKNIQIFFDNIVLPSIATYKKDEKYVS